ncbi:hypothetical protein [Paraburkholderia sp. BL21I4N1]|uniref:hypothetical protein n=1 Tax=Paraburkholderia sp. BL21I4N1 TaxID=1938801 RepID=UPI000D4DD5C4|nr:hypothetical protein [Paraburkholderia sp. BL21I4N1]PQV50057.1 hypothetical protein B0G83_106346 [Paraburkholderia sp. BL21I4N1]
MTALFFKRSLTFSIPLLLINLALQYHEAGTLTGYEVAVSLVIFLLAGVLFEAMDSWRKRRIAKSRFAFIAETAVWTVIAIGLFVFFYRMS